MQRITPEIYRNQWCCLASGFSNKVAIGVRLTAQKCTNLVGSVVYPLSRSWKKNNCVCVSIKERKRLEAFCWFLQRQAGSFAGFKLMVLKGCWFRLSAEAFWVILLEDGWDVWPCDTDLLMLARVRAFGVDQTVKTSQIYISFVIDLNGCHPNYNSEHCSYCVEIKSLKTGQLTIWFFKDAF